MLGLDPDVGRALVLAFARGYLDVPYCLHPDNAGRARSRLDADGRLHWSDPGSMPVAHTGRTGRAPALTSTELLGALSHVQRTYDRRAFRTPVAAGLTASR